MKVTSWNRLFMKKLFLIFVIIFLQVGALAKSPPPGSGTADIAANVLILLDVSGSMNDIIVEGDIRYAIDAAINSSGTRYVATYTDKVYIFDNNSNYVSSFGGYNSSNPSANGSIDYINAIALDSNGNVYVADSGNGRIQKFDPSGNYLAKYNLASGPATAVALDSSDNIYALNGDGQIEKFNQAGTRLATFAYFGGGVKAIAVDSSDNIYATRQSSRRIVKLNSSGVVLANINTGSIRPYGIDFDNSGNIVVSDSNSHYIYRLNSSTGAIIDTWGGRGSGVGKFNLPRGVVFYNNEVVVADYNNSRLQSVNGAIYAIKKSFTKLDSAKNAIKAIVSDSTLTSSANFGMITWSSSATLGTPISTKGAQTIYDTIGSITATGGTNIGNAMTLASNYLLTPANGFVNGSTCQQNLIIVVSDGVWTDVPTTGNTTASSLYNSHDIKTFMVGFYFDQGGDISNYVDLATAGGTYPDAPAFADNELSLIDVLKTYISQIISEQLTYTVPTIIPGITNVDHILQSTFLYKPSNQWKGHLFKYSLASDGYLGSLIWDAGAMLNQVPAADRNIWTVGTGIANNLNNFTTTNLARLSPLLEESSGVNYTDEEITSLIQFIRGVDSYSEFPLGEDEGDTLLPGERWKLADIYHSRAIVVGKPSEYYSREANTNSESYYRWANGYVNFKTSTLCGVNCASREEVVYVGANDGMLHAFSSATGEEKWAFIPPSILPRLRDVISKTSGKSNSIFGVDGSPVVKDIYYDGKWKTILLSGLRQGGNSYFALDITNPDSPTHLFTFSNNLVKGVVSYWDESGVRTDYDSELTVPAEYNFFNLGESWSEPVIFKMKINGSDKWVAAFGGGYNSNTNPNLGSYLYIIDLENGGQIVNRISLGDTVANNDIVNAVPPKLTVITADTSSLVTDAGAIAYFTDLEGKLWKVNLTNSGTLYQTTRVFNSESTLTNDRLSYQELVASVDTNADLMMYFGTSDIQRIGSTNNNIANRILAVKDVNYPTFTPVSEFTVSSMQNVTNIGAACPTAVQNGWYINLDANEKVTSKATIRDNVVVFSKYTPSAQNTCTPGSAKITEYSYMCGEKIRDTELGQGMPTQAVVYNNKIYIGISSDAEAVALPAGFIKQGNLIVGTPSNTIDVKVDIKGWWEDF
jgi:type IV pilus assembly protein PilY1